ncbi:hypothetical protein EI94DRAFT_1799465 [Lactarius quietus]|nr:hypothetical protein EI94DRAFT_1799465 [Lactarius quietus]
MVKQLDQEWKQLANKDSFREEGIDDNDDEALEVVFAPTVAPAAPPLQTNDPAQQVFISSGTMLTPLPYPQPTTHPTYYPQTVLWTLRDCLKDPDVGVSSANWSHPPMRHSICHPNGMTIDKAEWKSICEATAIVARTRLECLDCSGRLAPGLSCKKKFYKRHFATEWNVVLWELEGMAPLLSLCAGSWKADAVLGRESPRKVAGSKGKHQCEPSPVLQNAKKAKGHKDVPAPISNHTIHALLPLVPPTFPSLIFVCPQQVEDNAPPIANPNPDPKPSRASHDKGKGKQRQQMPDEPVKDTHPPVSDDKSCLLPRSDDEQALAEKISIRELQWKSEDNEGETGAATTAPFTAAAAPTTTTTAPAAADTTAPAADTSTTPADTDVAEGNDNHLKSLQRDELLAWIENHGIELPGKHASKKDILKTIVAAPKSEQPTKENLEAIISKRKSKRNTRAAT